MALSPGRLNRRVQICRATKVDDGKGGRVTTWPVVATVWAEVIGQNSREAVIAQALQGISAYRITMRYRTDITDADQILYGAIGLNIKSISDPDGAHESLVILADTESVQPMG